MKATPQLEVRNITVDFVGLRAVNDLSFEVEAGQIVGLIGPNGAGKTTLFNVISGLITPTSGSVHFEGIDVSRRGPAERSRLGVGRTFQIVKPFGGLSVLDNVMVGALTRGQRVGEARETARSTLAKLRMDRFCEVVARSLPLALRKRLELARALVTVPKILLLDEMLGGLTQSESNEMLVLIEKLNVEGLTFLVIEHNMNAIMRIAQKIIVMNQGSLLTQGVPSTVTRDAQVISIYLGEPIEST